MCCEYKPGDHKTKHWTFGPSMVAGLMVAECQNTWPKALTTLFQLMEYHQHLYDVINIIYVDVLHLQTVALCVGDYQDLTQVELLPIYPWARQFVLHSSQHINKGGQPSQIGCNWRMESSHHLMQYEATWVVHQVEGNFLLHHKVVLKRSKFVSSYLDEK